MALPQSRHLGARDAGKINWVNILFHILRKGLCVRLLRVVKRGKWISFTMELTSGEGR